MKIADLTEGYNPYKGLKGEGIPDGFRLVKDDRAFAKHATVHNYHFVGEDGVGRLLHIVIGHPNDNEPDHPSHMSFDVTDENGNYQANLYDHGRSGDVMQAVAHTVKTHIGRFDPKIIQWIAQKSLRRMYRAILSKVAPGYEYAEDGPLGSITKKALNENAGPPMDIYEVVHHFLEDNSELEDGDLTFGECIVWSKALIYDLRDAGFDANLLRLAEHRGSFPNAHPEWLKLGSSVRYSHYVVLVEGWTIDVTRRQFDPNCSLPVIEPLEQTKREWADVSIVADDR